MRLFHTAFPSTKMLLADPLRTKQYINKAREQSNKQIQAKLQTALNSLEKVPAQSLSVLQEQNRDIDIISLSKQQLRKLQQLKKRNTEGISLDNSNLNKHEDNILKQLKIKLQNRYGILISPYSEVLNLVLMHELGHIFQFQNKHQVQITLPFDKQLHTDISHLTPQELGRIFSIAILEVENAFNLSTAWILNQDRGLTPVEVEDNAHYAIYAPTTSPIIAKLKTNNINLPVLGLTK